MNKKMVKVLNTEIGILSSDGVDYISLTDMANTKNGASRAADIIKNWLRNRYTLEFIGTWEQIHNPVFKVVKFDHFRMHDVLNMAMFGQTAAQWREAHPTDKGNIRDHASINELICLSNMENINAVLINEGVKQSARLTKLNAIAIQQMRILCQVENRKLLK